jgi:hypothetical protein
MTFTPANDIERALADAAAGRLDEAGFYRALHAATLLMPQPFAQDEGPTRQWSIAVFEGVCPAYTSVGQLTKALPAGMAYAEVPVQTLVKHWDVERPMALNFLADLAVQIPGPVVAGLPTPRVGSYDTGTPPEVGPPRGALPEAFQRDLQAFAERHGEVRSVHVGSIAAADGSEQALIGLAVAPAQATGPIAAALAGEVADDGSITAVAHPFAADAPDPLAQALLAVAQTVWAAQPGRS